MPTSPESTVVFGRNDELVAEAAGELVIANLAEIIIVTGGVGKDTGDLLERGYASEGEFLGSKIAVNAFRTGYRLPLTLLEEAATNGGENARFSIDMLLDEGARVDSLTAVAHATSARRLAETLKHETGNKTGVIPVVYVKPSKYEFDPANADDRDEAAAELLRLADWPAKGWLGPQVELPENLVDFVRDVHGDAPKPMAPWQSAILHRLPPRMRFAAISFAAKHGHK